MENIALNNVLKRILSKDFEFFFESEFNYEIYFIEKMRRNYLLFSTILTILSILIIGYTIFYFYPSPYINIGTLIIAIVIPIGCFFLPRYTYITKAKRIIFPRLLHFIGDFSITTSPQIKNEIKREIYNQKIIRYFNKCKFDDVIIGAYNDTPFSLAEVQLIYIGNNTISINFKGLMLFCKINNYRDNDIQSDIDESSLENRHHALYSYSKYDTENCILPESLKKPIMDLANYPNINKISISIENGNVTIALDSLKNWFEFSYSKPATDIELYRHVLLELALILSILDAIKNAKDIGL